MEKKTKVIGILDGKQSPTAHTIQAIFLKIVILYKGLVLRKKKGLVH